MAERILSMVQVKSLFDCFDKFTEIFFKVTGGLSSDSELRVNMLELYLQVFRGLREIQKSKISQNSQET